MNAFDKEVRLWRKKRLRGVSPIIATILLVAITVVLAAVLYVLVSGLTHTGASTPYNVGFTTATPSNPATNNYWEVIPVSPTTGLTTAMFSLSVQSISHTSVGTIVAATANCKAGNKLNSTNCAAPASGSWYIALAGQANSTVIATFGSAGWSGTFAVTASMEIVLVSYVSYAGTGDTLAAVSSGGSSISGSVSL
jgi:archaeal type IV pilus assembly protein PilA